MKFGLRSRAFRIVLGLQSVATLVIAAMALLVAGVHGAVSAMLGGLVTMLAGVLAGLLIQRKSGKTAEEILFAAIMAEVVRIGFILVGLGFIFATYDKLVPGGLIGAFIITVLIFPMAIFIREDSQHSS